MYDQHHGVMAHVRRSVREHFLFPTVDQLYDALFGLAAQRVGISRRQIGNTRLGDPMHLVSIGRGARHALGVAGVHPEPVGFHTILALWYAYIETPELFDGWTWDLLVLDQDTLRLNEPWFRPPLTLRRYYRGLYRPAVQRQPLYNFPLRNERRRSEGPPPETWALMGVIEELGPRLKLVMELHNGDFGGAWVSTNRRLGALADAIRGVVADADLRMNEAPFDAWGLESDGPGVFVWRPTELLLPGNGASLVSYLSRDTLRINPEVSLFRTEAPAPPPGGHGEGLMELAALLHATANTLEGHLADVAADLTVRTPFEAFARYLLSRRLMIGRHFRDRAADATASHYEAACHVLHSFRLRGAGHVLRALEAELAVGNVSPTIRSTHARLDDQFEGWCVACEEALQPQPCELENLENLVRVQVETALRAARHLDEATRAR